MQKFKHILSWLDEHILEYLAYFLVVFIPLMPKLPLFEAIPGYIVRVRSEDILIAITGVIWLVQFFRGKILWKTPLTWLIAAYAVVGILSTISAVVWIQTVPGELLHVGKTLLHYFRYLEYFFLFFVVVTSIKTKKQLKIVYALFIFTLIGIAVYGYGQRHYYWPVYSTMNREFSKGIRLVLTDNARVQSTFGGHYDLAAYLVVVMPLILASLYAIHSRLARYGLVLVFVAGMWLMVQTSSRSSFLGLIIASYTVIGIFSFYKTGLWKRIGTFIWHSFLYTLLLGVMIFTLGQNMYDRFLQTIAPYPILHNNYHEFNRYRKDTMASAGVYITTELLTADQMSFINGIFKKSEPPSNSIGIDDPVLIASDTQPTPVRPSDVTVNIPNVVYVTTTSAEGVTTTERQEVPREYSDAALKSGLSAAIRYDTLWPRAIAGFQKNPLLGSGYATLTKEEVGQFTEAESTDNNFLRTLGETGALGFITFYGVVVIALKLAYEVMKRSDRDDLNRVFAVGFIAGTIGLLVNAIYIDVFAASKVAFTFWALAGVVTALYLQKPESEKIAIASFATKLQGISTSHSKSPVKKKKHAR
jgi:hypothetical protein